MSVLRSPERIPGISISLGESINSNLSSLNHSNVAHSSSPTKHIRPFSGIRPNKLPPAVANVPPDHVRGYVHSKKVNHYLVGSTLGEGSFAKVKEAFHVLVGEKVAMKIIDKKKAQQDPYVAKNFKREAKLLQMVRHPNILQLMEVIETDTSFYLITELCSGGELMKHIYKKGRLDETETRKFMRQIVSAVDHLHKAGIIHRDLKVENMLLDSAMDIKIIDFGLSNEEYVQGENGRVHCSTQCGSPAYAAPELLGHKEYGPEVDIWSIGVNMYAMLTGCLPYTVEPFNITTLHAKMLENKMNPIPDFLSQSCKDLLQKLLRSNPEERVKISEIMSHPWMNEGHALPFGPFQFPNKLQSADVNEDIVEHMVKALKVKDSEEELAQELISNRATNSAAVYYLLVARLARYKRQFQHHRVRHKSKKLSRDQGYFEGDDDEDDAISVSSMPTRIRRPAYTVSRQQQRPSNVPIRSKRPGAGKDRPISHPPAVEEQEEPTNVLLQFGHRRRSTVHEIELSDQLKHLKDKTKQEPPVRTIPEAHTRRMRRANTQQELQVDHHRKRYDTDPPCRDQPQSFHPHTSDNKPVHLAPVRPPPSRMIRNAHSHSTALNMIRQDLNDTLHPPTTNHAWHSNPNSRNSSRNPSRQGTHSRPLSRAPSGQLLSSRTSSMNSGLDLDDVAAISPLEEDEELTFHTVNTTAHTFPRSSSKSKHLQTSKKMTKNFRSSVGDPPSSNMFYIESPETSNTDMSRLPSLSSQREPPPPTRQRTFSDMGAAGLSRGEKHGGSNGYFHPQSGTVELKTALGTDEILGEIIRVSHNLKMREVEKSGHNMIQCMWKGIRFQLCVLKDRKHSVCKINFNWLSGGDLNSYSNMREQLVTRIKL